MLRQFDTSRSGIIIDGTFGGGRYSRAILKAAKCSVVGIDRDLDAIVRAEKLTEEFPRFLPLLGRFGELDELGVQAGFPAVDGVVLDIGVSSFQIDEAGRGSRSRRTGRWTYAWAQRRSKADVVNLMGERDLANVIFASARRRIPPDCARHRGAPRR